MMEEYEVAGIISVSQNPNMINLWNLSNNLIGVTGGTVNLKLTAKN